MALMLAVGCATHVCTARGCMPQLSATLRTPTGAWPNGVYELAVRTDDGLEGVCMLRLPEQLPDPPGKVEGTRCGTNIQFALSSESECQMGCDGTACWQKCTPIPGKFVGRLTVDSTPPRIALKLVRDGTDVLVEDVAPAYQDVYPNGPECGGACRQAALEYTLP